ncbi:MAG: 50S ribosomal protein L29 [Ignavibacteria bacterium]|nr:50S ribosomal protein L29 [Ignavibacteria bacterium]
MKPFELRELSDAELLKRIQEEEESLSNLRFQKVLSQLENPMKLRLIRKDIARMRTILRERQLKSAPEKKGAQTAAPEGASPNPSK